MKKTLLLLIAPMFSIGVFAQRAHSVHEGQINITNITNAISGSGYRTTAIGDTEILKNITLSDTITQYYYGTDSGSVSGTNAYGDMGFAENYFYNGNDSSLTLLGVVTLFHGKVLPTSAKTVNLEAWNATSPIALTSTLAYSGFPGDQIDTLTVPVTQLGIGTVTDTLKTFLFPVSPVPAGSFFIGYQMNYNYYTLAGDTIGLACSKDGERTSAIYNAYMYVSDLGDTTRDTVINVQNATQWSDLTWHDNYTDNDSLFNDLAIYPIVSISNPTGIKGVTRNNLTMYGCYPNPASESTNIKFSLAKTANITLQLTDMKGQSVITLTFDHQSPGEHVIPVPTSGLASGNYIYLVRCSTGEGMAGQLTIAE